MFCLSKVIKEDSIEQNESISSQPSPLKPSNQSRIISLVGPIRARTKKKNKYNNAPVMGRKTTIVTNKTINDSIIMNGTGSDRSQNCKKLAQLLHELPCDNNDQEYCPQCPNKVILEYIEKPPMKICPLCGLGREELDITSSAVHDKETPVHLPFHYRPKQYFLQWIKRITGCK